MPLLTTEPVVLPPGKHSALAEEQFGVKVTGGFGDINNLTPEEFAEVEELLYRHNLVLFPNVQLTPSGQMAINLQFDPSATGYGHSARGIGRPDAATNKSNAKDHQRHFPQAPAAQTIGNGVVDDPELAPGLELPITLVHPSHKTFHRDVVSDEDTAKGFTRFYRWHIDAALYELDPPKVTTLYALTTPTGERQTVRYDDGTADELDVPKGGTAFSSGRASFSILSPEMKSLAVRTKVQYAPHPYAFMSAAKALPTGLGMYTEGKELAREDLPPWEESKIKVLPMLWKNPVTGELHLQVHPSGIEQLHIAPLPAGAAPTPATVFPDGAHITDLKQVRELVYSIQRPGIGPEMVYVHEWTPRDLAIFHNRGVLHSITSEFAPEEKRLFWQCNLAASVPVEGPSEEDVMKWA